MKSVNIILGVFIFMANSNQGAALAPQAELKKVFVRPLIVGASVSADYLTPSPGKRLALRYTSADQIKVCAGNGKSGREILPLLTDDMMKDRSVLIGVDLFFWDSWAADPQKSVDAIDQILAKVMRLDIPIVIGEIPNLSPHMQPGLKLLNKKIISACGKYPKCHLLPLDHFLRQLRTEGYLTQGGKRYSIEELMPDGLHLGAPASEFLADQIQALF